MPYEVYQGTLATAQPDAGNGLGGTARSPEAGLVAHPSRGRVRRVVVFAVCASLSALGVEVPEAVWAFVPTVAVGAIGVVARDEKVTSEAAGAQANSPPTASPRGYGYGYWWRESGRLGMAPVAIRGVDE